MGYFLQMTLNGLVIGFSVMLLALGFQLIVGVMRIVNFAHAEFYMLGAFIVWWLHVKLGAVNYWLAVAISTILVGVLGVIVERAFLRPVRGQLLPQVAITAGLLMALSAIGLKIFGAETKAIPPVFSGTMSFVGISISAERIAVVLITAALLSLTLLFWLRSKRGMAIRAFAAHPEGASLQGVSADHMSRLVMMIGCGLAGAAGGLVAPLFAVEPYMGTGVLLKVFVVVTLAGMGSVGGVIIAAIVLGLIESYAMSLVSAEVGSMIYFAILAIVLIFRPSGLFGKEYVIE